MKLTQSEFEIMDVLWKSERSMTVSEIRKQPHEWKDSSFYIFADELIRMGAVAITGRIKNRKAWARLYGPNITREQYYAQLQETESTGQIVTSTLIAEILRANHIDPDAAPSVLAAARDEFDRGL